MYQLENFENYIKSIPKNKWEELFKLIPEVEAANVFGVIKQDSPLFLEVKPAEVVKKIMAKLEEMKLFPLFEWIKWREGQRIINDIGFDLNSLTLVEVCMLLTVVFRLDKFNEGFLVGKFEDGTMLRILKVIRIKIN